jgi:hypothetical protein
VNNIGKSRSSLKEKAAGGDGVLFRDILWEILWHLVRTQADFRLLYHTDHYHIHTYTSYYTTHSRFKRRNLLLLKGLSVCLLGSSRLSNRLIKYLSCCLTNRIYCSFIHIHISS